jgi:cation transport regulator
MPYERRNDLPDRVRGVLPAQAQDIYLAAYNSAWNQYQDPEEREGDASREETAHKVAWAAVKQRYEKDESGDWVEKD